MLSMMNDFIKCMAKLSKSLLYLRSFNIVIDIDIKKCQGISLDISNKCFISFYNYTRYFNNHFFSI